MDAAEVEVTFWHMAVQGLGAWVFKELSKNPSIWTLVSVLQTCQDDQMALETQLQRGEAEEPASIACRSCKHAALGLGTCLV